MSKIDLSKYGISGTTEIVYNPSYEQLYKDETCSCLEGYEKGQATELDTVNVMTGIYTGRSPKDKYIVKDATSENTVWWTSDEYKNDNKPVTTETWNTLKEIAVKELSNKKRGLIFILMGMVCLFGCLVLLIFTESIFSTVLLYFSLGFNIIGLYILMWIKDRRDKNDKK